MAVLAHAAPASAQGFCQRELALARELAANGLYGPARALSSTSQGCARAPAVSLPERPSSGTSDDGARSSPNRVPRLVFTLRARGSWAPDRAGLGVGGSLGVDWRAYELVTIGGELRPAYLFFGDHVRGAWAGVGGLAYVLLSGWGGMIGVGISGGAATLARTGGPPVGVAGPRLHFALDGVDGTVECLAAIGDAVSGIDFAEARASVSAPIQDALAFVIRGDYAPLLGRSFVEGGVRVAFDANRLALELTAGWQQQSFQAQCEFGPCPERDSVQGAVLAVAVQYRALEGGS